MRRLSILCAAAGLAFTALAATSPAQAGFHVIRWQGNGLCQIWDEWIPTMPFPSDYTVVSKSVPTFWDALVVKDGMLRTRACVF